jgi:hypothetical protein
MFVFICKFCLPAFDGIKRSCSKVADLPTTKANTKTLQP